MAITLRSIVALARAELTDPSGLEWDDFELARYAIGGVKDLWRDITPLHEDFFTVVDDTSMTLPADSTLITEVPSDVYKVTSIEPRLMSTRVNFEPRAYNSSDAKEARRYESQDIESGETVYYSIVGAGANSGSPRIYCAPPVRIDIPLSVAYVQSLTGFISGLEVSNTGRSTAFSGDVPIPVSKDTWAEVDYIIPSAGEGQILWPNASTPIFQWADFSRRDKSIDTHPIEMGQIAYAFPHPPCWRSW